MSHFYGTLKGNRGEATRAGSKGSGIVAYAASWKGAIAVRVYQDEQGRDCFAVSQEPWQGAGVSEELAHGYIGEKQPATALTERIEKAAGVNA